MIECEHGDDRAVCPPCQGPAPKGPAAQGSTCRSCGAEIVWAVTRKGKRMPVDADPSPDGNCYLSTDPDGTVRVHVASGPRVQARIGHTSHFTSCPQADRWRSA